jgi:amidase
VLDCVAGPGTGDPYTAPAPAHPWSDDVGADPGRLRIGFRTRVRDTDGGAEAHPDCVAAVQHAAALLESLGHHVEPHAMPHLDEPGLAHFGTVTCVGVARDLERWGARLGRVIGDDDVEPNTAMLAQIGRQLSGTAYFAALEEMQAAARAVASWWDDDGYDVLLTPTSTEPPFLLGGASDSFEAVARSGSRVSFTAPFDATGQPAISVPLYWTEPAGDVPSLPIGVQLVAAYGREDVLIRLASQLEAAAPWAERRPPHPAP